jgi:hypothetical protein
VRVALRVAEQVLLSSLEEIRRPAIARERPGTNLDNWQRNQKETALSNRAIYLSTMRLPAS